MSFLYVRYVWYMNTAPDNELWHLHLAGLQCRPVSVHRGGSKFGGVGSGLNPSPDPRGCLRTSIF